MKYLKRIVDDQLKLRLEAFGAVQIKGPKWCGKTTTAEKQANSIVKLQDPDTRESYLATVQTKPSLLLKGKTPRLIDEWQVAPVLWDAVRHAVDERQLKGQFILTGSTVIDDDDIMHTGTGRISKISMYPMSLYESQESNGSISIKELFDNKSLDIDGVMSNLSVEQLIFAACRGGWPASLDNMSDAAKLLIAKDYVDIICSEDISKIDKVQRNPSLARLIMRSYARNLCTLAKKTSMLADVSVEMEGTSILTFNQYVEALEKLFVIEDVEAWSPAIRSATVIRTGKKRCFVDPSIAVAALGASPQSLELDLKTFGFIYECMCIRDLKIYSQSLGGVLSYYHDRYGLEADAVLHLSDGRYALIECKLGSRDVEAGAKHLLELKNLIEEKNKAEKQIQLRLPDLLIVLTGGEMAYTREDGVKVIPLGCLKD
ncbi:putative AAA+ superfamily ATPase [Dysgonomonadaceae bacterium PH5-43]|nr:putative AAA+ superfamily ATPase [Dysgonomonadaceae bacterium PH5-43]